MPDSRPEDVGVPLDRLCVDVKTGAAMLGLSEWTLRQYIDAGFLPVIRFPSTRGDEGQSRRLLLSTEDLKAFRDQHRELVHVPDRTLSQASVKGWRSSPMRKRVAS